MLEPRHLLYLLHVLFNCIANPLFDNNLATISQLNNFLLQQRPHSFTHISHSANMVAENWSRESSWINNYADFASDDGLFPPKARDDGGLELREDGNSARPIAEGGLPNASNQLIANSIHKEDNVVSIDANGNVVRSQTSPDTISITFLDSDGPLTYFQKSYKLGIKTNIKKALDQIRSHICTTCSNPQMLEFWFETTEVNSFIHLPRSAHD